MIPDPPSPLERQRFIVLTLMRAGGVVVMLLGLWIWLGALLPRSERTGMIVFAVGVIESLLLPALLASRWRTPPRA